MKNIFNVRILETYIVVEFAVELATILELLEDHVIEKANLIVKEAEKGAYKKFIAHVTYDNPPQKDSFFLSFSIGKEGLVMSHAFPASRSKNPAKHDEIISMANDLLKNKGYQL